MSTTAQWITEAEERAKKAAEQTKINNQYLIDELVNSKNNSLQQLQNEQNNAIYKINANKSTINQNAEDNANNYISIKC